MSWFEMRQGSLIDSQTGSPVEPGEFPYRPRPWYTPEERERVILIGRKVFAGQSDEKVEGSDNDIW